MRAPAAVLGIVVLLLALWLIRADRDKGNHFNLYGFLMNPDGTTSRSALVLLGSFVVASWVVVLQSLKGTLSDLLYGTYLTVYAVPAVSNQISNTVAAIKGSQPAVTTQTVQTTQITPQPPPEAP